MQTAFKNIYDKNIAIVIRPFQKKTPYSGVIIRAIQEGTTEQYCCEKVIPIEQIEMVDRDVLTLLIEDAIANLTEYVSSVKE